MAGLTKTHVQLGDSITATQNFTLTSAAADGTMKLARGNSGSTTQDIITVAADGNVQLTKTASQSMVRVNTANGYGSTNTKIRRFTTTVTNQGTDITYTDSATLGASFTINTNGVYAISYSDCFNVVSQGGLSLNTTVPTTGVASIPVAEVLQGAIGTNTTNSVMSTSWTGYLVAGGIVRAHTGGDAVGSTPTFVQFTITRVS